MHFNITEVAKSAILKSPKNQDIAKKYLANDPRLKKYIIGKNDQSLALVNIVRIDGIIDDYDTHSKYWSKIPVLKSSEISPDSIVANCSSSISPISVSVNLSRAGIKNIVSFHELVLASDGALSLPAFVLEMRKDVDANMAKWVHIYELLNDRESKKTFIDLFCYRLTADPDYMKSYNVRLYDQYFETFMKFSHESFVDIGGYNGDTSEEFGRRFPDYKKIFFFEPSSQNMTAAKVRLNSFRNIEYFEMGLSDKQGELAFNPDGGSSSSIMNEGNFKIQISTLDKEVEEPVSFIKIDIEGWELKALAGCRNHIINDNPKLAIAVYHNSKDFYEIPNYILSINPNYTLFLRHYTEGWSETVMYFVPEQ